MATDVKNRLYVNSNQIQPERTRNRHFKHSCVRGQNRLFVVRPLSDVSAVDWGVFKHPEWLKTLVSDTENPQDVWVSVSWIQRMSNSDVTWGSFPRWDWKRKAGILLQSHVKKPTQRNRILNMIEQWVHRDYK